MFSYLLGKLPPMNTPFPIVLIPAAYPFTPWQDDAPILLQDAFTVINRISVGRRPRDTSGQVVGHPIRESQSSMTPVLIGPG